MYKGTTPTFIFTFPESVNLENASNIYVSFAGKDGDDFLRLTGDAVSVNENVVSLFLTQEQTLRFPVGSVLVQVNWTYNEGGMSKRACSDIRKINFRKSLADTVLA